MAQTKAGALIIAAKKTGLSVNAYVAMRESGKKWCFRCRSWHEKSAFGRDVTRFDGMDASCKEARKIWHEDAYRPMPIHKRKKGNIPHLPRGGDKIQARMTVNRLVKLGRLARPSELPCFDCGHTGEDKRHEYDHYLGYAAEVHQSVQAVCLDCHVAREKKRRKTR